MTYGRYKRYRPWLYRSPHPILWWTKKWAYVRFILRELTSLAVVAYAVVLLFFVRSVFEGPEAYRGFIELLGSPISIALHAGAFLFVVFHSVTWFNLAPRAMVLRLGRRRVPSTVILVGNYLMWVVISAAVLFLACTG